MSAFVVDKAHIDALLAAALRKRYPSASDFSWWHEGERHTLTRSNADQVGAMLWAENCESVGYRYSYPGRIDYYGPEGAASLESDHGEDLPGKYVQHTLAEGVTVDMPEWAEPYTYATPRTAGAPLVRREFSPVTIFKAIQCYAYQSCEHDGWESSSARAFCDALREHLVAFLPGYDDAPWGISD